MDIMWTKLFFPPNPTSFGLGQNVKLYFNNWAGFIIMLGLMTFAVLIFFYFFTRPNPRGNVRFWLLNLVIVSVSIISAIVYILTTYKRFLDEPDRLNLFYLLLSASISAFCNVLIIYLSLFILLMVLSLIRIPWNLRAMRRYPFKWMP